MNRERLLKLADYLENEVAKTPELFDMATWGLPECGSVCCAFGHACKIPEFQEAGLRLINDKLKGYVPYFDERTQYSAAAAFFGILPSEADYLFDPGFYEYQDRILEQVVTRIRNLASK